MYQVHSKELSIALTVAGALLAAIGEDFMLAQVREVSGNRTYLPLLRSEWKRLRRTHRSLFPTHRGPRITWYVGIVLFIAGFVVGFGNAILVSR